MSCRSKSRQQIVEKKLKFYVINGYDVAEKTGMGGRMNTIMQTAFFAISGILPREQAIAEIKHAIEKTYGKRGEAVVQKNFAAVDATIENLSEVKVPAKATSKMTRRRAVPSEAPEFVQNVIAPMLLFEGDDLPVSAMPVDGTFPTGTTQWEKRNIALDIPVWETDLCIQCGKCIMVCPHAVITAEDVRQQAAGGRTGHVQAHAVQVQGILAGHGLQRAGRARGLHGLHACAWKSARPRTRPRWDARRSTWRPSCRSARARPRTGTSS